MVIKEDTKGVQTIAPMPQTLNPKPPVSPYISQVRQSLLLLELHLCALHLGLLKGAGVPKSM